MNFLELKKKQQRELFLIDYLSFDMAVRMYSNIRPPQPGVPQPPTSLQPNPFGNAFQAAGSGLIRGGLGAYGEKIFGSSSEYVQSNVCTILVYCFFWLMI